MNSLTDTSRIADLDTPRFGLRNLSHLSAPGRWYVRELIEMARCAVASAMPSIQAMSLQGHSVEMLTYLHKSDGLNWGDVRLVQKGEKAPEGFELVAMPAAITGATPYDAMITALIEKHLMTLPVLPVVPSPYVPLHLRGENKIIAAERDDEGKFWTVSFREAGRPFAVIGNGGSVAIARGEAEDGYVVQRGGSPDVSSGESSFWYSAADQNSKELALRMLKAMTTGESDTPAMRG